MGKCCGCTGLPEVVNGVTVPDMSRYNKFLKDEIDEINQYKWLTSEAAGYDLGLTACEDWIDRFAGVFREEWEKEHGRL